MLQLCQNLVGQRPHTGSLPSPGMIPPPFHKPLQHSRETHSRTEILRMPTNSSLGLTRSYDDLTQPGIIQSGLRSHSPPHANSSSSKRSKHSVSFSCETVLQQCHGNPSSNLMETQVEVEEEGKEGLETRIDEPEFEPETAKESSQHALGKSLVTAAAAVLRRHKNTRKNT